MALTTESKKDQGKKLINRLKLKDVVTNPGFWSFPPSNRAERSPDDRREDLAKMLLWGIFLLFLFLSSILAILVFNNNQNATIFKDVFLTYTGIASGIAVSIVSFYYKNESKN